MTPTPTPTTPTYRPLPTFAPRAAEERAEAYGLRAILFVTAERVTAQIDREGLELAAHCFRLAIAARGLSPEGAERLADVGRLITAGLTRRDAYDAVQARQTAPEATQRPAGEDTPRQGPGAPLSPAPKPQAPPAAARTVPALPAARVFAPPVRLAPVAASTVSAEDLF